MSSSFGAPPRLPRRKVIRRLAEQPPLSQRCCLRPALPCPVALLLVAYSKQNGLMLESGAACGRTSYSGKKLWLVRLGFQ